MYCPFCGNQNREGKVFCRQCGQTLPPSRSQPHQSNVSDLSHSQPNSKVSVVEEIKLANNPPRPEIINTPDNSQPYVAQETEEENLYNTIYPPNYISLETAGSKASPLTSDTWHPSIATKTNLDLNPLLEELEDRFNQQGTEPLLPDTMEVPRAIPLAQLLNPGNEKAPNGTAFPPRELETSISESGKDQRQATMAAGILTETGVPLITSQAADRLATDKSTPNSLFDKALDTNNYGEGSPNLLNETKGEPFERGTAANALPAAQNLYSNRIRRIERIALVVAIIFALVALGVVAWLWIRAFKTAQCYPLKPKVAFTQVDTIKVASRALKTSL